MKEQSAEAIVEEILIMGILNGKYKAQTWLQPERELALEFGYSRPVVHKAIIRLESKGLLTIVPRQGVKVNDYREAGKLGLLESIYHLYRGGINKQLNQSMLRFIQNNLELMVILIQCSDEENRKNCHRALTQHAFQESEDVFLWLQSFAFYCGNVIYPMLLNEFKIGILNVSQAVIQGGDRQKFYHHLKAVMDLVQVHYVSDREDVHHKVQVLFDFIEQNWLVEGEAHEIVKSST